MSSTRRRHWELRPSSISVRGELARVKAPAGVKIQRPYPGTTALQGTQAEGGRAPGVASGRNAGSRDLLAHNEVVGHTSRLIEASLPSVASSWVGALVRFGSKPVSFG